MKGRLCSVSIYDSSNLTPFLNAHRHYDYNTVLLKIIYNKIESFVANSNKSTTYIIYHIYILLKSIKCNSFLTVGTLISQMGPKPS